MRGLEKIFFALTGILVSSNALLRGEKLGKQRNRALALDSFNAFRAHVFQNSAPKNDDTCTYSPSKFQADVVVEFMGFPETVTADEIAIVEKTFEQVYNGIAKKNCDPSFRTIANVTVSSTEADIAGENRMLQMDSTLSDGSRARPFSLRLMIEGNCRGCETDAKLFNDGSRRRLDQKKDPVPYDRDLQMIKGVMYGGTITKTRPIDLPDIFDRFAWSTPLFDCSCEITGKGDRRTPIDAEVNAKLDSEMMRLNALGSLPSIQRSLSVSQVVEVECESQDESFVSTIFVDATGDPENISEDEKAILERLFLDVYREASAGTCDENFRVVSSASATIEETGTVRRDLVLSEIKRDLAGRESAQQAFQTAMNEFQQDNSSPTPPPAVNSSPRFRPFRFRFQVTGQCKGCRGDARLFNDGFRRSLGEYQLFENDEMRKLGFVLDGSQCFCALGALPGQPPQDEFAGSYNRAVQVEAESASIPNVGAISDVTQVNDFIPSVAPSESPSTIFPSMGPSLIPTKFPTNAPSQSPTISASSIPSVSSMPSAPTESPVPSPSPSLTPTL